MRVAVFSTKPYDVASFAGANEAHGHELVHLEPRLTPETVSLADGCDAICAFVNDDLGAPVLERLSAMGIETIALRSAGFNHVDLDAAGAPRSCPSPGFRPIRPMPLPNTPSG